MISDGELSERKMVECAKGLLMQRRGFSEETTFKELRSLAMTTGKSLGEVVGTLVAVG